MKDYYDNEIKPLNDELGQLLNVKQIEVTYIPSEEKACFGYAKWGNGRLLEAGRHFRMVETDEIGEPDYDQEWKERDEW